MKRFSRQTSPHEDADPEHENASRLIERNSGITMMRAMGILAGCLMILPVLFIVSVVHRDPPPLNRFNGFAEARVLDVNRSTGSPEASSRSSNDKLLGGLLTTGFDENSCLSRYQSSSYRKPSPHKPSSYLQSRLRKYEELHKKCGPYTKGYNKTVKNLKSGKSSPTDCSYVVWISYSGLGNRILTLASSFLYALLTNRVLLVDRGKDMSDLFCEPFPDQSWLLPLDFPLNQHFNSFDQNSPHCYGNLLKQNSINNTVDLPFLYLHLSHDYNDQDKMFFCDEDQSCFKKIPWLVIKTDNYFVPSLFLINSFEEELSKLFLVKDSVFHHLGRYLFHPKNAVWGLISRYYKAYLANADERVGIQIRVFETGTNHPFPYVLDQIKSCFLKNNLLPQVSPNSEESTQKNRNSKAVLITSLYSGYFEDIRNMYWENPSETGELIGVYQPSNEVHQQTEKTIHNRKALAEMYLLSLMDVLITSSWSTFGYVAQGLGGLRPWILYKPENQTAPEPACGRVMSMEPCFHAPPFYDCKAKTGIDTGEVVPHVRHCEDMSWGLKLVEKSEL